MKVFTHNKFKGHYPVGTAAVIVAKNKEEAALMLADNLKRIGLEEDNSALKLVEDMQEIDQYTRRVEILNDGDY